MPRAGLGTEFNFNSYGKVYSFYSHGKRMKVISSYSLIPHDSEGSSQNLTVAKKGNAISELIRGFSLTMIKQIDYAWVSLMIIFLRWPTPSTGGYEA